MKKIVLLKNVKTGVIHCVRKIETYKSNDLSSTVLCTATPTYTTFCGASLRGWKYKEV